VAVLLAAGSACHLLAGGWQLWLGGGPVVLSKMFFGTIGLYYFCLS
jgi:hypothetical protein